MSNSKILVAFYSASGTTESTAKKIAKILGADLLEIKPQKPYSNADLDWTNPSSRVCAEHDKIFGKKSSATAKDLAKVQTALEPSSLKDLSAYKTVFIGYPIWWGIAAWPVDGFVTKNDLSEKTVIPFCTVMSSGLGESDKILKEVAGEKGNWLPGKRFGTSASESEVRKWIDSLGIK